MTEHRNIKKALELIEMIEFILSSSEHSLPVSKEQSFKMLNTVHFPFAGLNHSVGEVKNILLALLNSEAGEDIQKEPEKIPGDFKESVVEKDIGRGSQQPRSSSLVGRIRPVPEEVRGRVRELVDMIEHEELSRSSHETTGA